MHAIAPGRGAGALLLTIGLAVTGTAYAHPSSRATTPTCDGHSATVVGAPGATFTGTDHRDVIVSNGGHGSAEGGNDLICVTGRSGDLIDAGAGNDVVDARKARGLFGGPSAPGAGQPGPVWDVLGPGDDTFRGGPAPDRVFAGEVVGSQVVPGSDSGHDSISTGGGRDSVWSGDATTEGLPNNDVVHLGPGNDLAHLLARPHGAGLHGGRGRDALSLVTCCRDVRTVLDDRRQVMSLGGNVVLRFDSFSRFVFGAPFAHLTFRGSSRPERLVFEPTRADFNPRPTYGLTATMAGGDDVVHSEFELVGSIRGGPGDDSLRAGSDAEQSLSVYTRGHMIQDARVVLRFAGIERSTWVVHNPSANVVVRGTSHRDDVVVDDSREGTVGTLVMRGLAGDDRLTSFFVPGRIYGGPGDDVLSSAGQLYGGRGDDEMRGGPLDDILVGGPGHDTANGKRGQDQCRAEVEHDCELPVVGS
jgi:Ca2+-binding RTX toxin-like protein